MAEVYDVAVVGGGPGGYVAAIRAAQLGLRVALVEQDKLGGLCLNWGCIPSKALLRNAEVVSLFNRAGEFGITVNGFTADMGAAVDRSRKVAERLVRGVESLMRKNKITVHHGRATLKDATTVEVAGEQAATIRAKNIIIATGGKDRAVPSLPVDGETVITSRHALLLRAAPKNLVIVGAGAVGMEFSSYFSAYGSKVTVVEMLPRILPQEEEEVTQVLHRALEKNGVTILTGARVEGVTKDGDGQATVRVTRGLEAQEIPADKVLVAVGFVPNTQDLGLEKLGVQTQERTGFIVIDDQMRTNVPNVYAIGDVTGKLLLAHVAEAMGVAAAEAIAGKKPHKVVYENMPRAVYSSPQVASIGITESTAKERGYNVKVGKFPFRANGKALGLADYEGHIKIVSDERTGAILGAQMVGPEVSELLGEFSVGMALEATPLELGRSVHPHPSLSEVLMEAALAAGDEAIHI